MDILHKDGSLITRQRQSNQDLLLHTHFNSRTVEMPMERELCTSPQPTPDGGNSSNTKRDTLPMFMTRESLMLKAAKIWKVERLELGREMDPHIRDGVLSMLMKLRKLELRVSTMNGDSTSTDHSTLDQNSQ
jgi:hypothetical protein